MSSRRGKGRNGGGGHLCNHPLYSNSPNLRKIGRINCPRTLGSNPRYITTSDLLNEEKGSWLVVREHSNSFCSSKSQWGRQHAAFFVWLAGARGLISTLFLKHCDCGCRLGIVVCAHNPTYSGHGDQKDRSSRPAQNTHTHTHTHTS
jgi:hypothetical protein